MVSPHSSSPVRPAVGMQATRRRRLKEFLLRSPWASVPVKRAPGKNVLQLLCCEGPAQQVYSAWGPVWDEFARLQVCKEKLDLLLFRLDLPLNQTTKTDQQAPLPPLLVASRRTMSPLHQSEVTKGTTLHSIRFSRPPLQGPGPQELKVQVKQP